MAQEHDIADALRSRIIVGEWTVGEQLPTIAELQDEYGVRSPTTVRVAQQRLVTEGLLESRRGVGVFVVGTEPLTSLDPIAELDAIAARVGTVAAALRSQSVGMFSLRLDDPAEPDMSAVLRMALDDFRDKMLLRAEGDPDDGTWPRWAAAAERLLTRIDDVDFEPPTRRDRNERA